MHWTSSKDWYVPCWVVFVVGVAVAGLELLYRGVFSFIVAVSTVFCLLKFDWMLLFTLGAAEGAPSPVRELPLASCCAPVEPRRGFDEVAEIDLWTLLCDPEPELLEPCVGDCEEVPPPELLAWLLPPWALELAPVMFLSDNEEPERLPSLSTCNFRYVALNSIFAYFHAFLSNISFFYKVLM